jgi:DNA-binding NtrC family response regulator
VADDEPLTRWALTKALEPRGAQVTSACSPEEVRAVMQRARFDLLVIACCLGGVDMADVLEHARGEHESARLVLLCDDESAPVLRQKFPHADVVEKPFSIDALLSTL